MNKHLSLTLLVSLVILSLLMSACGGGETANKDVAVAVALTQTAAAQPPAQPPAATATSAAPPAVEMGTITGFALLQAPPTPPMVVYALDINSGEWAVTETTQVDGEAPFTLKVKPGNYQMFAWVADKSLPVYAGYSNDGKTLTTVTVAAGQAVAGIRVMLAGAGPCVGFSVPASPDGRFPAVPPTWTACNEQGEPLFMPCTLFTRSFIQMFGVAFESSSQPFQNILTGQSGPGCQIAGTLNGVQAGGIDVQKEAHQILLSAGWSEDGQYAAGGPMGILSGFRQGAELCALNVGWGPTQASLCSNDEPFGACWERLTPEQKLYTIKLNCTQP